MFLLFSGDSYYPRGGFHDYQGCFPSEQAAIEAAKASGADWWHVVCGASIVASN